MTKEYITHWVIGIVCTVIWFWGDKWGIPKDAQILAASTVPGLLGNALGKSSVAQPVKTIEVQPAPQSQPPQEGSK